MYDVLPRFAPLAVAVTLAGCGLALDFDPPDLDAGRGGIDAEATPDASGLDSGNGCGGCAAGEICREGSCWPACIDGEPCHLGEGTCDACVEGACVPVDVTCGGGTECASAGCDPIEDRCVVRDTCGPGLACVEGGCVPATCASDDDCAMLEDECGPYACGRGMVCAPPIRPVCPPIRADSCAVIDPCTCTRVGVDPARCVTGHCDESDAKCVECLEGSHCAAGERCDLATRTCGGCATPGACPDAGPVRDAGPTRDASIRARPPSFGMGCIAGEACPDGPCRTTMPDAFCYETACTASCEGDEQCRAWVDELGATSTAVACVAGICDLTRSGLGTITCE